MEGKEEGEKKKMPFFSEVSKYSKQGDLLSSDTRNWLMPK